MARIPDPPEDLTEMLSTLRLACADVMVIRNATYGLLLQLWWD